MHCMTNTFKILNISNVFDNINIKKNTTTNNNSANTRTAPPSGLVIDYATLVPFHPGVKTRLVLCQHSTCQHQQVSPAYKKLAS